MDYLTEKNIAYTKKLVDQNDAARDEMTAISGGFLGVPYTVIEIDGAKEAVIGFDKNKINEVLKIA